MSEIGGLQMYTVKADYLGKYDIDEGAFATSTIPQLDSHAGYRCADQT
jgi:hypothetical protein